MLNYKINLKEEHRNVLLKTSAVYKGLAEKSLSPLLDSLLVMNTFNKQNILITFEENIMKYLFANGTPVKDIERINNLIAKVEESTDTLIANEEELLFINEVLELSFRVAMGQFSIIYDKFMEYWEDRDVVELLLYNMRKEIMTDLVGLGASYGIRNKKVHEDMKIACDMQQVFRTQYYWDNWDKSLQGGQQIYFDTPLKTSSADFVTIEKI